MKRASLFMVKLLLGLNLFAQYRYDHTWLLGAYGPGEPGVPDTRFGMNIFEFSDNGLHVYKDFMDVQFFLTNSSISDENGQLLFFSNGCKVFNADYEVMENGSGLNPGIAYSTGNCPNSGNALPNGLLILQKPDHDSKYYIFHEAAEQGDSGVFGIHTAKLYYSLVNMEGDTGLGTVVEKNKLVIADTLGAVMHAVRHANGVDWWVVEGEAHRNNYFKVLFTENGVEEVKEQSIGGVPDPFVSGGSQACFSPDGKRYARVVMGHSIYLFDFDRETGDFSNYQELFYEDEPVYNFGGLAISSNSRFLYMCNQTKLWQFDLEADDIQASRVLVGEYDGYEYLGLFKAIFFNMRLAPDCKIYMAPFNSARSLHVIHNPNEKGTACNFVQHEFELPAQNNISIPNFPNYRLGTGYPVCDSTIQLVVHSEVVPVPRHGVVAYPNPATNEVTIKMAAPLASDAAWALYNGMGQQVLSQKMARGTTVQQVPLSGLPKGLYFWAVGIGGERMGSGKLVVVE